MTVLGQIATGSALLIVCTVIHLSVVSRVLSVFRHRPGQPAPNGPLANLSGLCLAVLAPLFSHTVQIYLWSFALLWLGALDGYEASIYFLLVSYTTLGYGDVTLGPDFRILGAMSAVTGIIMFGITTAFLVALFGRIFERR